MKVGDYVGWADHDVDEEGPIRPAGIILDRRRHSAEWGEKFTEFLILLQHNGELAWEFESDLVMIHESR